MNLEGLSPYFWAIVFIIVVIKLFSRKSSKFGFQPDQMRSYSTPPNIPAENDSEYKNCFFCGEEIKSVALKCKHCGSFLNEKGETTKSISGDSTFGTISIVAGIAGFLIGIFLFHIGVLLGIVAVVCGYLGYTKGQQYSFPGMIIGAFAIVFSFITTYMSMARFY